MKTIELYVSNYVKQYGDTFNDYFFDKNSCETYLLDHFNHLTKIEIYECYLYMELYKVRVPDDYIALNAESLFDDLYNGDVKSPDYDPCFGFGDPDGYWDLPEIMHEHEN